MPTHQSLPHPDPTPKDTTPDWEKHLRWIAPASGVILLLSALFLWVQNRQTDLRTEVSRAYTLAGNPEALAAVAEAYPDQPEAPLALLQAASGTFNAGDAEGAENLYNQFLQSHPRHPLRENAEWGLWMCAEAKGDLETALEGFRSVDSERLLYPQALLGRARILEKQAQLDAALDMYEQIQEEFPQTPWAEQARVFARQAELHLQN